VPTSIDSRILAAFTGATIIGGANFVAVSVSNQELPPLWGAALRFGSAATLFFLLAIMARVPVPRAGPRRAQLCTACSGSAGRMRDSTWHSWG
jgi:drug/metabolite transporter (DMT)-like permease